MKLIRILALLVLAGCGKTTQDNDGPEGADAGAEEDGGIDAACLIPSTATFVMDGGAGCEAGTFGGCFGAFCCEAGTYLLTCAGGASPPVSLNCSGGASTPGPSASFGTCCGC
jgi:hypothetical protein